VGDQLDATFMIY